MGDYYDDDDDVGGIDADMEEFEDSESEEEEEESESEEEEELPEKEEEEEEDALHPEGVDIEEPEHEPEPEPEKRSFALLGARNQDEDHRMVQIVSPEDRITSDVIQLPEMTEAIGIRVSQIESGMSVMPGVNVEGMTSPIAMAQKEFIENKNPLILRRIIQQQGNVVIVEDWEVCKMAHPPRVRFYLAAIKKKAPPIEVGDVPEGVLPEKAQSSPIAKKTVAKTRTGKS